MAQEGQPTPPDPFGALCWRNWKEHESDSPPAYEATYEATLYSDANFTGWFGQGPFGPYSIHMIGSPPGGELREALVVRWSWHVSQPSHGDLVSTKSLTDSWLRLRLGVDQEIAALLAVFLGVRVWSGGITREFGPADPYGYPVAYDHVRPIWHPSKRPVLPDLAGAIVSLDDVGDLLGRIPTLEADESVALIRAARQYQLAIWVADEDPELAWLQLVSAAEVAATFWKGQAVDPTVAVSEAMPELVALLRDAGGEPLVAKAAATLARLVGSTRRFLDFMMTFDPGPPQDRCTDAGQVPWEQLRKRLRSIYTYRSNRLHSGEPFPAPLHRPPLIFGERPSEKPEGEAWSSGPSHWRATELPMYLWLFERIVHGALLRWFTESLGSAD